MLLIFPIFANLECDTRKKTDNYTVQYNFLQNLYEKISLFQGIIKIATTIYR